MKSGTGWANAEVRSYSFADSGLDDTALIETLESRQQRGLTEKYLDKKEQSELRHSTMESWVEWGMIS
jgi:hypothetical protein